MFSTTFTVYISGLHGGGCKVPSNILHNLLEELGGTNNALQSDHFVGGLILPRLGKKNSWHIVLM